MGRTCVSCGDEYDPDHGYVGEYCPQCEWEYDERE